MPPRTLAALAAATAVACGSTNSAPASLRSLAESQLSIDGLPRAFAPEIAWGSGSYASPSFTPDGTTVYFTHAEGEKRTIVVSRRVDGAWSAPEVAAFSGVWRDVEPAMAPDGSYLVFISNRPAVAHGRPLDGFFGGQVRPGAGGAIWRVDLRPYREPVRLPDIVNATSATYSPAVAGDGSVYFNRVDPYTWKTHIYRAQARGGTFLAPEPLTISDGSVADFDVAVAPDERFIVFSSNRPPAKPNASILFVAYRRGSTWTEPQPLAPVTVGLEARLAPDLRRLYFEADLSTQSGTEAPGRIFEVPLREAAPPRRRSVGSTSL